MKKTAFVSILVPIAATIVLMVISMLGLKAQNTTSSYHNKMSYTFENNTNEFYLYGVGQVILKSSSNNVIRCEVSVTGFGKDTEEAKMKADNIEVTSAITNNGTPKLYVNVKHGRYNKRNCEVVTTVYLPNTVTFQHNEDIDLMEFIYRVIDKFKH